jgi:hypothetical protein
MATAQQYATWIVANQAKKGTPEFDTVARAYKVARGGPQRSLDDYKAMSASTASNPTDDMGVGEKVAAGAGQAVNQAQLGAAQHVANVSDLLSAPGGLRVTAPGQSNVNWQKSAAVDQEVAETAELDKPLMETTAGKVGNFAGNVGMALVASAVPGMATMPGATLLGATMGGAQPAASGRERAQNAKVGAVTGAAGQAIGSEVGRRIANKLTASAPAQTLNKTQQAAQRAAADGYVLPPTQANPSLLNRFAEGFAGKIRTQQTASTFNQETSNRLAKRAVGLADEAELSDGALEAVRKNAGKAYAAVSNSPAPLKATPRYKAQIEKLGDEWAKAADEFPDLVKNDAILGLRQSLLKEQMTPSGAIAVVRKLRFDAKANLRAAEPEKRALGFAQRRAADAVDELIETNLSRAGQKKLAESYKTARVLIAKTYDVEAALNDTTGNVSARYLAGIMDRGAPLTGELKRIAQFSQAFPKAAQNVDTIGSQTSISPLDTAAAGIGAAASGRAEVLGAIVGRPAVRSAILSKPYQRAAVVPKTPRAKIPMKRAPEIAAGTRKAITASVPVVGVKLEQE